MKLSKTEESMRFHTQQACQDWLRARDRLKPDVLLGLYKERVRYPAEHYRTFFAAHWIATSLTYRRPTLLWITEWGIWPSSENHHLYLQAAANLQRPSIAAGSARPLVPGARGRRHGILPSTRNAQRVGRLRFD